MTISRKSGPLAGEGLFKGAVASAAAIVLLVGALMVYKLAGSSAPSLGKFGLGFLVSSRWDPVEQVFGALPFLWGTFYVSVIALAIALPLSLGIAIFLTELSPVRLRQPVGFLIELLAAIPSLIYGLWGLFVLAPLLQDYIQPPLSKLDFLPFFTGYPLGIGVMTAGIIVAVMITPTISAISRDIMLTVPEAQKEGGLALGMTRWEVVSKVVIPYSRPGILGAVVLGFGRALGETMAVTMVIGNTPKISLSLFEPGYTVASAIANEFAEATEKMHVSALIELGLILFVASIAINSFARVLMWRMTRDGKGERV